MPGKAKLVGKNVVSAKKMLHKVTRLLRSKGIVYCLEGGTLLGIVREARLLPWDTDMDISIMGNNAEDLRKLLLRIWLMGYQVKFRRYLYDKYPFKKGEVRLLKIYNRKYGVFRGPIMLDVFVKKKVGDEYYWAVGNRNLMIKKVPARFYDELDAFDFDGGSFLIPKDYPGYLAFRYGDWKTPVKDYHFRKDDLAIVND